MNLKIYPDAATFLSFAKGPLLRDEAKNNLILGIAERVKDGHSYGDAPPYFLTVDADGELVAAAIRTPPYSLILYGEEDCLNALRVIADHLARTDPAMPGVNGEAPVATAFAEVWSPRLHVRAEIEKKLRIYALRKVDPPTGIPGRMRRARSDDVALLVDWMRGFFSEAAPNDPPVDPRKSVHRLLDSGTLVVWDDDGLVSMAGSSRSSAHGATVSAVYTPPEYRRKGYASACVAALSQLLLDRGYAFCTLYTDLLNPTSNKIYQQVGYRPVSDAVSYRFVRDDEAQ
jgi:predicted GNAT family acetyltransferase